MHILYRLCDGLGTKPRPDWFTKKGAFVNCQIMFPEADIHVFVDGELTGDLNDYVRWRKGAGTNPKLFLHDLNIGRNSGTFLYVLDFACRLDEDKLVYFVEDDYVHRQGSEEVLLDGLKYFDYVTLYDHPDKYTSQYDKYAILCGDLDKDGNSPTRKREDRVTGETTSVMRTSRSHWKCTRSTTMTFAARVGRLREDRDIFEDHCRMPIPRDHNMFAQLVSLGRQLVSPIPGYSTHAESKFLAPGVDWKKVFK